MRGFNAPETIFYAVLFVSGAIACLSRIWARGEGGITVRCVVGRCFSSGIYGFGVVAIWLGRIPADDIGSGNPYAFVAVAAFVGLASRELQERIIAVIFEGIMQRIGARKD